MFKNRNAEIDALKAQIQQHRPLDGHTLQQLKEYFRIGLTYTSNALEGNSLTETETKVILEDGLTIGGKTMREHQEVIGHSKAFDAMYVLATGTTVTEADTLKLHKLFYQNIDATNAGIYRTVNVLITGTDHVFPAPTEVPGLMRAFIAALPAQQKTLHPVTFAAWVHAQFVTIHPFVDGNGRTARLLMNLVLLQHGYVITIIPPVMRAQYLASLRQANKGEFAQFYDFISTMAYESHKEYLRLLPTS